MARALRFAALVAGLALGVFSLAVARGWAGYSFGGSSAFAGAAELAAGYALLAVGFTAWMRPRQARLGGDAFTQALVKEADVVSILARRAWPSGATWRPRGD